VDKNGRVAIPADFRKELGDEFVVTLSGEHCIKGYTVARWREILDSAEEFDINPRTLTRNAKTLTFDKQGRVTLPENLLEKRGLGVDREVAIVGVVSYIEIWDAAEFNASDETESSMESVDDVFKKIAEQKRQARLGPK
jgi:MraZ protein